MSDIVFPLSPARPAPPNRLRRFARQAILLALGGGLACAAYPVIARQVAPAQPAAWWQARFTEAAGKRMPVLELSRDGRGRATGTLALALEPGFDTWLPVANVSGTETSVFFTVADPAVRFGPPQPAWHVLIKTGTGTGTLYRLKGVDAARRPGAAWAPTNLDTQHQRVADLCTGLGSKPTTAESRDQDSQPRSK